MERRSAEMERTESLGEAEMGELIVALGDDLILVDPDVAVAGQDVDMRF